MKKAYGYLRVSTTGQVNGSGYDRQKEAIEKYCKENRIDLLKVYEEQVSGTKGEDKRPVYHTMINDCTTENVQMIIVEGLDRLSRRYGIQTALLEDLVLKKIDVIAANTGENCTEATKTPIRELLQGIEALVNQYQAKDLCRKLNIGRQKSVKVHGEFRLPRYGRCGKDCKNGHSERCKHESAILKRIKNDRKVKKGKRKTFHEIAADLNAEGITTRQNNKWSWMGVFNVQKHRGKKSKDD